MRYDMGERGIIDVLFSTILQSVAGYRPDTDNPRLLSLHSHMHINSDIVMANYGTATPLGASTEEADYLMELLQMSVHTGGQRRRLEEDYEALEPAVYSAEGLVERQ
jgi:hypothetical protein